MRPIGLVLLAALSLRCATPRDPTPPPVPSSALNPPPFAGSPRPPATVAPAASASAEVAVAPVATADAAAPSAPTGGPYATFYAALRDLEAKRRQKHVRVFWMGDSHGFADYWSGELRTALQSKFGDGGPGFVHLGFQGYRHDGVRTELSGKWKTRPRGPSTAIAGDDGTFGLGGMLTSGYSEGPKASVTPTDSALRSKLSWDLCYRLDAGEELAVDMTGAPRTILKETPTEPAGALTHTTLLSDPTATLAVAPMHGSPELCGVVLETDPKTAPGVVLDTLGINGARYATALAWDEAAWGIEFKRREPELVILEYGTNELSDLGASPSVFTRHLTKLVARLRSYRADVSCLVLAPTDRLDREEIEPTLVAALEEQAKALGCGFWDTFDAMGGKGSIDKWRNETPPRAAKDGVHLSWRGYRDLGAKLYADLMKDY